MRTSSILTLHVKKKYFDMIKSGEKKEEYRLFNDYWINRITFNARDLFKIKICCGYPRSDELDKIISFPYRGYMVKEITNPEFGGKPATVFAIKLEQ